MDGAAQYKVAIRVRGSDAKMGSTVTVEDDDPDLAGFLKAGVLVPHDGSVDDGAQSDPDPDDKDALGAALQKLVSEGAEIADLRAKNVPDINALTGLKSKRRDIDEALDLIVADQASTKVIETIVEAIKVIAADPQFEEENLTPDAVRVEQVSSEVPWTDEQIAAATAAWQLTRKDD